MYVHQVFLKLIRFGKELHTAGAAVLSGLGQVVDEDMVLQKVLSQEPCSTLSASEPPCLTPIYMQLHVCLGIDNQLLDFF